MACTGRAYAVRRFLEVLGIHTFLVPPVMPAVSWLDPLLDALRKDHAILLRDQV